MATTTTQIPDVAELQSKVLELLTNAKAPAAEYTGKVADAVASRIPQDRPELLSKGIDTLVGQVDFAKKFIDARTALVKTVLDAAVKPLRPVRRPAAAAKARTVKAA